MENNSPPVQPSPLAYATPGADSRVLYRREDDHASVTIHRPGRRERLAWDATFESAGEGVFWLIVVVAFLAWLAPMWLLVVVPGAVVLVLAIYTLYWRAYARLDRPIVIEVTPTEVVFSNLDERRRPVRLGRERLYAIRYVEHAKSVFVYRRGLEMWGFYAAAEGREGERMAAFLADAAGVAAAAAIPRDDRRGE